MGTISISFANELRSFWQEWNIRIFVLLSQFLQIVLVFLMPHRKSSSNSFILLLIKATYVLSYIVAGMALTYISSGMPSSYGYQPPLVLWASFIVLHLSGLGGWTAAYTIDEYETWYKHMLNFISHDMVTFLVILLQWHQAAVLAGWAVILVVAYISSIGKMAYLWTGRSEPRIFRLYRRELHSSSVDVNGAVDAPGPEAIEGARRSNKELDEVDLVRKAFEYCGSSEKLFLGLSFTGTEREQSRKEFLELNPKDAVRVVEIELNIAYDSYYAGIVSLPILKYNRFHAVIYIWGLIMSGLWITFYATLGINRSFLSFSTNVEDKYKSRDWIVTRILFFSNVFLEFMGVLRYVTSDQVIACWNLKRLAPLLSHMRRRSSSSSSTDGDRESVRGSPKRSRVNFLPFPQGCLKSLARVFFRRWSETISTRSFMIECLMYTGSYSSVFTKILRWRATPSTYGSKSYNDDIGIFIFTQLQKKAISLEADENAGRDVLELQGDLILCKQQRQTPDQRMYPPGWYLDLPFDIRQLLWHIATEILYNTRAHQQGKDPYVDQCRDMSNRLSEYMMYLSFECPHIMSRRLLGNFHVRYHDIGTYIRENSLVEMSDRSKSAQEQLRKLYDNGQRIEQPVLLQAVKIADGLKKLDERQMWEVISAEWVEILVYAATHCDPMAHVEKLAEGGELITIIWLLSAHLGLGNYFLAEKQRKEKKQEGCCGRLMAYMESRL